MITYDSETLLDNLESEVVGVACGAPERCSVSK